MLVLPHDSFFGDLRLSRVLDGVTVSHHLANSPPERLPVHTHTDAHFVLITSGDYISSATGDAHPRTTLIYNPPGTTHRDHFWQEIGSFLTVSLSSAQLSQSLDSASADVECVRWNSSSPLKAESLCLELLAEASDNSLLPRTSPPAWLIAACELIQDCPGDTHCVRDVAKRVGVHAVHLARAFRKFVGCTPGGTSCARVG